MEAFYPVFVLLLTLCEAPPGKTVCEEGALTFQFANALDCWEARAHFIRYFDSRDDVIVKRAQTTCKVRIDEAWGSDREELQKFAEEDLRKSDIVPQP
jgi:hypothetical protein